MSPTRRSTAPGPSEDALRDLARGGITSRRLGVRERVALQTHGSAHAQAPAAIRRRGAHGARAGRGRRGSDGSDSGTTQSASSQPPALRGTTCAGSTGVRSHTRQASVATFARCASDAGTNGVGTIARGRSGRGGWRGSRSRGPDCRREDTASSMPLVGVVPVFLAPPRRAQRCSWWARSSLSQLCPRGLENDWFQPDEGVQFRRFLSEAARDSQHF
jgi:hypothetical protein